MLRFAFSIFLIASFSTSYAQKAEKAEGENSLLAAHFGLGFSANGGDLKSRFDNQNALAAGLDFFNKKGWTAGIRSHYFFGNTVNEDPLVRLRTPEGLLIGNDRRAADVVFKSRGWAAGGQIGRLFSFEKGERAGVLVAIGAGWQQHKIRLQDDSGTIVQIAGDYEKGYDRLAGGPFLSETVGYQLFSKSRRLNFFFGVDAFQSRSQSLRDFDFALGKKDETVRRDLRVVPRIALFVPFYLQDKGEDVFY